MILLVYSEAMTLERLVGARLAVGFPGTEVTDGLIAHLRAIHARSLVVFEDNFHSPDQFITMHRFL